jgi:ribosomal protein S6--L-glutamate ligase
MILSFHPCIEAEAHVILGDRFLDPEIRGIIHRAKAILLPQSCSEALYQACSASRASLFPSYEVRFQYPGKVGQALLFERFGFLHPRTFVWRKVGDFEGALRNGRLAHRFPFLIKSDREHEGEGVYLVKERSALRESLDQLKRKESSGRKGLVSQEFIDSGGNVLRSVIVGTRIVSYWKRPHTPEDLITTISRGARIDYTWQPELLKKGETLARSFSEKTGVNLAAIDFVFDLSLEDPTPYFLEVNYYFGRRGLGGAERYYALLHQEIGKWLESQGLDAEKIRLT